MPSPSRCASPRGTPPIPAGNARSRNYAMQLHFFWLGTALMIQQTQKAHWKLILLKKNMKTMT